MSTTEDSSLKNPFIIIEPEFTASLPLLVDYCHMMGEPTLLRDDSNGTMHKHVYVFEEKALAGICCRACGGVLESSNAKICSSIFALDENCALVEYKVYRVNYFCSTCGASHFSQPKHLELAHGTCKKFRIKERLPFAATDSIAKLTELALLDYPAAPPDATPGTQLPLEDESIQVEKPAIQVEDPAFQVAEPAVQVAEPTVDSSAPKNAKSTESVTPVIVTCTDPRPSYAETKNSRITGFVDRGVKVNVPHNVLLELLKFRTLALVDGGKGVKYRFTDEKPPKLEDQRCPFCDSASVRVAYSDSKYCSPRVNMSIEASDRKGETVKFLFYASTFICNSCERYFHERIKFIPHELEKYTKFKVEEKLSFERPSIPTAEELVPAPDDTPATAKEELDESRRNKDSSVLNSRNLGRRKAVFDKISLNVLVALFDKYGGAKRSSTDKAVEYNFGNPSSSWSAPQCPECGCRSAEWGTLSSTGKPYIEKEIHSSLTSGDEAVFKFGAPIYHCACGQFFSEGLGSLASDKVFTRYFRIDRALGIDPGKELSREAIVSLLSEKDMLAVLDPEKAKAAWLESVNWKPHIVGVSKETMRPLFIEKLNDIAKSEQFKSKNSGIELFEKLSATIDATVKDWRDQSYVEYSYTQLLLAHILAVLRGHFTLEDVVIFCERNMRELEALIGLKTVPSLTSFVNMYKAINIEDVYEAVYNLLTGITRICLIKCGYVSPNLVPYHADGKESNGSKAGGAEEVNTLNLVSSETGAAAMQILIAYKALEPEGIKVLLKKSLYGHAVITSDAQSCKPAVAKCIIDEGADYILAIKGNVKEFAALEDACVKAWKSAKLELDADPDIFRNAPPYEATPNLQALRDNNSLDIKHPSVPVPCVDLDGGRSSYARTVDNSRGVYEIREYFGWRDFRNIDGFDASVWEDTKMVIMTIGTTVANNIKKPPSVEYRLFLCSLPDFAKAYGITRRHWRVEILHYALDYYMEDDRSKMTGQAAFAVQLVKKISLIVTEYARALDLCGKNFSGANMHTWASETPLRPMVAQLFSAFDADSYIPLPDPGKHVNEELAEAFRSMILHGLMWDAAPIVMYDFKEAVNVLMKKRQDELKAKRDAQESKQEPCSPEAPQSKATA
ncbi:MAG: hypothetical protein LBC41_18075 [Clostridiales bacterium]|nr:hypothetical protein [Clostridiales bacterium]